MSRGLIIAAPASGSGKTTITLALLRHLRDLGRSIVSAKVGPDYIDPAFHAAATGRPCLNLDSWAMSPRTFSGLVARSEGAAELVIAEGVMGLFDGGPAGSGSTADVAKQTGWPVVLIVDASGMASSAAALVHGFESYDPELTLAGVIFNRVGSQSHVKLLTSAMVPLGVPVLGSVPRHASLELAVRHLGLVQAREHPDLEEFLEFAAGHVAAHVDVEALEACARPSQMTAVGAGCPPIHPLGGRIAVARDDAFAFCYPFVLDAWRSAGVAVTAFSPLADEGPPSDADAVYLPGGYPELHAQRLANAQQFLRGMRDAAGRGATVYGECGGYMVLGRGLVDASGARHAMCDLLPVETSFENRRLTLGYRRVELVSDGPLGAAGSAYLGHEFHFASIVEEDAEAAFLRCYDAEGQAVAGGGTRRTSVMGSFVHLIDGHAPE